MQHIHHLLSSQADRIESQLALFSKTQLNLASDFVEIVISAAHGERIHCGRYRSLSLSRHALSFRFPLHRSLRAVHDQTPRSGRPLPCTLGP